MKRKLERKILEEVRNEYNRTLNPKVLTLGYNKMIELDDNFFPYSYNWFLIKLINAGLKGHTKHWGREPRLFRNFTELPLDFEAEELLEMQTGASRAMLPMIKEMQAKKQCREQEEQWKRSRCYHCSGEDCGCCEVFIERWDGSCGYGY